MAIGSWIAGRYTATYNSGDVGIMEDGYGLSFQHKKELIQRTDAYGDSVLDGIYRGLDAFIEMTMLEYTNATLLMLEPWDAFTATGNTSLALASIGELDFDNAKSLVLTAAAGTPAATKPATMTATKVIVQEGFDFREMLGPTHRKLPFRGRMLPAANGVIWNAT